MLSKRLQNIEIAFYICTKVRILNIIWVQSLAVSSKPYSLPRCVTVYHVYQR